MDESLYLQLKKYYITKLLEYGEMGVVKKQKCKSEQVAYSINFSGGMVLTGCEGKKTKIS